MAAKLTSLFRVGELSHKPATTKSTNDVRIAVPAAEVRSGKDDWNLAMEEVLQLQCNTWQNPKLVFITLRGDYVHPCSVYMPNIADPLSVETCRHSNGYSFNKYI